MMSLSYNIILIVIGAIMFITILATILNYLSEENDNNDDRLINIKKFKINNHKIIVYQYKDRDWPNFKDIIWFEIHIPKSLVTIYEKVRDETVTYSCYGGSAIKKRKQLYIGGKLIFDTLDGKEIIDEHEVIHRPDYNLYEDENNYIVIVYHVWRNVDKIIDTIKEIIGH